MGTSLFLNWVVGSLVMFALGRSGNAAETDPLSQPLGRPVLVNVVGRDREHGRLCFVNVGRIRIPPALVQIDEQHERRSRGSLVPVDERVIPGQGAQQDCCLVLGIRVELGVAEADLRGMER